MALTQLLVIAAAAAFFSIAGCTRETKTSDSIPPAKKRAPQQETKVVRTTPMAPDSPLHTGQIDMAKVRLDLAAVRAAIAEYRQLHDGKNPPDLATLGVRLSFPADIAYDAGSGTVKSLTYPAY